MKKLTPKQEQFCKEYLVDLNATQAAKRAGYSEKTAYSIGDEILKKPEVAARINELMKERGERTRVTADRVLLEIERMAMYDPADLIEVNNHRDIAKLPEEVRRAIVGWKYTGDGGFELKLVKEKAIDLLAKHHGIAKDRVEVSGKITLEDIVAGATESEKE
jgi:phage terminase small subunit